MWELLAPLAAVAALAYAAGFARAARVRAEAMRREQLAAAAVELAREQAVEAGTFKSQFLATMSHEIRTPINAIVGMSELLARHGRLDEEELDYARTIHSSAQKLLQIINDVLDISKLEAGRMQLEANELSPVALVESTVELLCAEAYAKGVGVGTYVAPDVPERVAGDEARLRQILGNLVGNAIKFTSAGSVFVGATLDAETEDDAIVRFTVADTGIGLSPLAQATIFEPFVQGDGSTSRRFGGTGLGLTISKQLVELMGGAIGVESEEGAGSQFWFAVPLQRRAAPAPADDGLRGRRLLVVDDDDVAATILARYANGWGATTETVADPEAALGALRAAVLEGRPYHIALIDLVLGRTSGFELAARIRAEPALRETRFVLVTAHDRPGLGKEAVDGGFAAYLRKPIQRALLRGALVEALRPHPVPVACAHETVPHAKTILLAEDNPVNQKLALRQLQRFGCLAEVVANGREAVDALEHREYDLVFMDVQMPEMDGFAATRAIRAHEALTGSHVPIVAMTANAMEGDREQCLAAGMDDYLPKPVQLNDIERILERYSLKEGR